MLMIEMLCQMISDNMQSLHNPFSVLYEIFNFTFYILVFVNDIFFH